MKHLIHLLLILCICHFSAAQDTDVTAQHEAAKKRFESAKQDFLNEQFAAVVKYYEEEIEKQDYTRFETYKMAAESYKKLAINNPEDSASYLNAAKQAYDEAAKWHGKMYTEEKWDSYEISENDQSEVFAMVDQKPEFPGGDAAMYRFLGQQIDYPSEARRQGIEGKVLVQFIVNKDGSLDAIRAISEIGGGCDEEAVRVISNSPNWTPGKINGEPVYVRMVLPVFFRLYVSTPKKKKKKKRRG